MMHQLSGLRHARHFPKYLKKLLLKRLLPGSFLQEFCARPGLIGAICPSSRFLARSMAREVAHRHDGLIIELGPGTGVVTQALLDHGVAPERLVAVEYSHAFVQRLRKQFPHVNVVHGNASELRQLIPADSKVAAIVSSLPLCALPEPMVQAILSQWHDLLSDDGIAVQFTYNLRRPKWHRHVQARQIGSQIVWANLPPAQLATFSFNTRTSPITHHDHPTSEQTC